ncbi:hypothetical protein B0H10DRAFT_2058132 [Mycena sp. CBHHK59/15]|nr:hypothetical protein B0H10DRAFT_2058132 [Mycena sp. CBHHK59/15]
MTPRSRLPRICPRRLLHPNAARALPTSPSRPPDSPPPRAIHLRRLPPRKTADGRGAECHQVEAAASCATCVLSRRPPSCIALVSSRRITVRHPWAVGYDVKGIGETSSISIRYRVLMEFLYGRRAVARGVPKAEAQAHVRQLCAMPAVRAVGARVPVRAGSWLRGRAHGGVASRYPAAQLIFRSQVHPRRHGPVAREDRGDEPTHPAARKEALEAVVSHERHPLTLSIKFAAEAPNGAHRSHMPEQDPTIEALGTLSLGDTGEVECFTAWQGQRPSWLHSIQQVTLRHDHAQVGGDDEDDGSPAPDIENLRSVFPLRRRNARMLQRLTSARRTSRTARSSSSRLRLRSCAGMYAAEGVGARGAVLRAHTRCTARPTCIMVYPIYS